MSNLSSKDFREDFIQKGFLTVNDVLEKAEGSRGGRVIGHTKSGKPIYEEKNPHDYNDFTSQDHKDAAELHKKETDKYRGAYNDAAKRSKHDNFRFLHTKIFNEKK